ncbi:MAG TPA: nucleotidyltransferase domain-containing protein [Thermoplasmata archaeon]|nr:nucleotidyltransferase domain-containing protein [Thermoplasmata archaeon]
MDTRVSGAALVGSGGLDQLDRWSDLDLTFGLQDGIAPKDVLNSWTPEIERDLGAIPLFDVSRRDSHYRVFLLPGNLQVDLSFTPGFVAQYGPGFRLLFGGPVERKDLPDRPASEAFGYGAHHAVRARYCIERGKVWQAEFWISGLRDEGLTLACQRRNLNGSYGRGFDQLPGDVRRKAEACLIRSTAKEELLRALRESVDLLIQESAGTMNLANKLESQLRDLGRADWFAQS